MIGNEKVTRRQAVAAGLAGGSVLAVPGIGWAGQDDVVTPPIETSAGKVRGRRAGGVSRFLGIPYGDDTGKHRFQPARAAPSWTGVRDCFAFGAQAPQAALAIATPGSGAMDLSSPVAKTVMAIFADASLPAPVSEACLFLDVYTPEASTRTRRPVMVWLHGGGFASGAGGVASYDGSALCRRGDVVVVTLNHRLNAMGYLYLGALHPDFADSGNVGMLDIVLALQWVRDNIAAFGGDPGNVTIFGESGGGAKVGTLLGMPPAKGLFHKAIQQSGAAVTMVELADAAEIGARTLASLGIAKADVHKLQTMDFKRVITAATQVRLPAGPGGLTSRGLAPCVDGRSLPAHPFHPKATELSRNVPLIIGTNKDEWTLFMALEPTFGKMTEQQARERFAATLGPRGEAAFAFYRNARPNDPPTYWVTALMTDMQMRLNSITEADRKSAQNAAPVYMYRLDWETPVAGGALRSPHGLDVSMVFDVQRSAMVGTGPEPARLTAQMSQAWVNFARTGNPSQKGLAWPRYDTRQRRTMVFDTSSRTVADPDRASRQFWAATA